MIKKITYIFIGLLIGTFVTIANAQVRVLTVPQGGTGAATLTGCLQGNGTGAITGTGSACGSGGSGSSVGWASTTADTNSIYFTGGSTGNVGIGTTTPNGILTLNIGTDSVDGLVLDKVSSVDRSARAFFVSGTNTHSIFNNAGNLQFYPDATVGVTSGSGLALNIGSAGNVGVATTSYAKFGITNTGTSPSFVVEDSTSPDTTPFIIDASGNVGIGTIPVYGKVEISSPTLGTNALLALSVQNGTNNPRAVISHVTSATSQYVDFGGSYSSGSGFPDWIFSTGKVGIGTTTPTLPLEINGGGIRVNRNSAQSYLIFNQDYVGTGRINSVSGGGLTFSNSANSTEWARFNSTGAFGIGTTSPYASLAITNTGSDPSFVVEDSTSPDSSPFIIDASGNVGIGTTTPGTRAPGTASPAYSAGKTLDINSGTTDPLLSLLDTQGTTGIQIWSDTSGGHGYFDSLYDGAAIRSFNFRTRTMGTPVDAMTILGSGYVGIGTTTPALQEGGASGDKVLVVSSIGTTNRAADIELAGFSNSAGIGNAAGRLTFTRSGDALARIAGYRTAAATDAGQLSFLTAASGAGLTEKMVIDPSGLVGIGTSTPYAKLAITNTGTDPSFVVEDSTSPDSTPFIIDASGNVGVGISTPLYKLDVDGSMRLGASSGSVQPILGRNTSGGLSIDSTGAVSSSNNLLTVANNGGTALVTVLGGGNVGIGTTSPYSQLSVGGKSVSTTLFALDALSGQTAPILDVKLASTTQFAITSTGSVQMTYASSTALSATTLCLSTDCRTSWPAGGAGGSGAGFASTTLDINSVYFTGGATGKIGIGTSTPNATLTIAAGKSFYSEQSILSTSTSMTVDFDNGQNQLIRTGVSDTTVAFSNGKVGQKVELTVCNPTTTSGAISFTGNVSYRGGISPSHTTTANECDIYVWQVNYATSTAKYFLMDMKSGFR